MGRPLLKAPNFTQWLRACKRGRLYEFFLRDNCWPVGCRTISRHVRHLEQYHANDPTAPSEIELRMAFVRYRAFLRSGRALPTEMAPEMVKWKYLRVLKSTDEKVRQLKRGAPARVVIERAVDLLYERTFSLRSAPEQGKATERRQAC